jgi:DNA-directed RNA polymerase specialized sigma24 family protein
MDLRSTVELPQGYTLARIEALARVAARATLTDGDTMADRVDDAWAAMVERLYADPAPISAPHLVWVGRKALYRSDRDRLREHGFYDRDSTYGPGSAPRFRDYWYRRTDAFEHTLVERHTLSAIWSALAERDREVLVAFAIWDDYQAAARALGIPHGSFRTYISAARRRFRRLWHEGETPSEHWGHNHPGNGGLGRFRRAS